MENATAPEIELTIAPVQPIVQLETHSLATLFPAVTGDELKCLAASIQG